MKTIDITIADVLPFIGGKEGVRREVTETVALTNGKIDAADVAYGIVYRAQERLIRALITPDVEVLEIDPTALRDWCDNLVWDLCA